MTNANETSPATPTAHTPGPYKIGFTHYPETQYVWTDREYPEGICVATVKGQWVGEALANARLFAAAPELLEACELLVTSLRNWMEIADEEDAREYDEEA